MKHVSTLVLFLATGSAYAQPPAPPTETPPGEVQSSFTSPRNQITEFCSLPRILDPASTLSSGSSAYLPFSNLEVMAAKKVCRADFYDSRESTIEENAAVVCPKVGSTNPALMFHELPYGMHRANYIADECPKQKRKGALIAKYKQTVSCSNTSAILGYPRFARVLKSEVELPFTAYRSMDRLEHLDEATKARAIIATLEPPGSILSQTWATIQNNDRNPHKHRGTLYKAEDSLIFGALVPDLKGGNFYATANGKTAGDRVANFQVTNAFQAVTNPAPVSMEDGTFSQANAQKMILLREMGDLIVLDTLLNQQDRFGNLEYRLHYLKVKSDGEFDWEHAKSKDKVLDPEQAAKMRAEGYVLVKRMLLDDNDCGVSKENKMARAGIAQRVTHLHPDTYRGIQDLQKLAAKGMLTKYLKDDLLFRDADVKSVQANLLSLATMFKEKCLAGKLFLDADLAQFVRTKPRVDSVAFCQTI